MIQVFIKIDNLMFSSNCGDFLIVTLKGFSCFIRMSWKLVLTRKTLASKAGEILYRKGGDNFEFSALAGDEGHMIFFIFICVYFVGLFPTIQKCALPHQSSYTQLDTSIHGQLL